MKIISWNVNGINSCMKKGLLRFIEKENADIILLQEVKVSKEKINPELLNLKKYNSFWSFAKEKGYSGLAVYSKSKPLNVIKEFGKKGIDKEGRIIALEFDNFFLINVYFPHSNRELKRLKFKLMFNNAFEEFCKKLGNKKPVIIGGDFNVAHKEIDLRNPKQNTNNAGFTIKERNWFDKFLKNGYIDCFRNFTKEGGNYTWWTYRNNARARNIGWRIDYFLISKKLKRSIINCSILNKITGSDHCPISLEIK